MFTVLGASGFIGAHVAERLRRDRHEVLAPPRDDTSVWSRPLGHVVYCVGLTADFRERPFDTVEAHVSLLSRLLRDATLESLLYLSSTRVYAGAASTCEKTALVVRSDVPGDLYNLSKLMGESLCLNDPRPAIRVARLSNVFGAGASPSDFLPSVLREARDTGRIVFRTTRGSSKDYVEVGAVAKTLVEIAVRGRARIYNVASGTNTTHEQIASFLERELGARVSFAENAPAMSFPPIDCTRVREEFGFSSTPVLDALSTLLAAMR